MTITHKKPGWFFYFGWVALTVLSIAVAWEIAWIIIKQVVEIVGGTVVIDGRTRITEDWLAGYVFVPLLGLAIGLFQYLLLRRYLPRMGWWVAATTLGWFLAAAVITLLRMLLPDGVNRNAIWLVLLMLVLIGGSVGLMQWLVLRRRVPHAGWWIPATIAGWLAMRLVVRDNLTGLLDLIYLSVLPAIATSLALWLLLASLPPSQEMTGEAEFG